MTDAEKLQLEVFEGTMIRIEAMAQQAMLETVRPSVLFKPTLSQDGDKWCLLLGKDLATGFAAFGSTPNEAALNFDYEWSETPAQKKEREARGC